MNYVNDYTYEEGYMLAEILDSQLESGLPHYVRGSSPTTLSSLNVALQIGSSAGVVCMDTEAIPSDSFRALYLKEVGYASRVCDPREGVDINGTIIHMIETAPAVMEVKEELIDLIFQVPYEDVPLLIKDNNRNATAVASWRMKIGR
jgi:hypothetical protein